VLQIAQIITVRNPIATSLQHAKNCAVIMCVQLFTVKRNSCIILGDLK